MSLIERLGLGSWESFFPGISLCHHPLFLKRPDQSKPVEINDKQSDQAGQSGRIDKEKKRAGLLFSFLENLVQ